MAKIIKKATTFAKKSWAKHTGFDFKDAKDCDCFQGILKSEFLREGTVVRVVNKPMTLEQSRGAIVHNLYDKKGQALTIVQQANGDLTTWDGDDADLEMYESITGKQFRRFNS